MNKLHKIKNTIIATSAIFVAMAICIIQFLQTLAEVAK